LQIEGFSHRYLGKGLKVGALHTDGEEHELCRCAAAYIGPTGEFFGSLRYTAKAAPKKTTTK